MSWRQTIVRGVARVLGVRNEASAFEAAGTGRRARSWVSSTVGPNAGLLGSLALLRARSRAAVRNDGVASGIIADLVSDLIGTGVRPLSQAPDKAFQAEVQRLWARWSHESDPEGLHSIYGQQALVVRAMAEGGDTFARFRPRRASDGLSVPLQLQILEAEVCPSAHTGMYGGHKIRGGIEFDPIGRRAAYYFYRQHPGEALDLDTSRLLRVPADEVLHVYPVLRPGQIRGLPHLTQALVRLYELDQMDDATLVRVKLANMFVGFYIPPPGDTGATTNPITGETTITRDANGMPELIFEPGTLQRTQSGAELKFSEPPDAGDGYDDFMRRQLRAAATAAGTSYEMLTGDMRDVNDRTVRVLVNKLRRRLGQLMAHVVVDRFCQPTWEQWFDAALYSGALRPPAAYYDAPDLWRAVRWQGQRHEYLNPVQDVEATRTEVRSGLTSLSAEITARGEDPDLVFEQLAADQRHLRELGVVVESDAAVPLSKGLPDTAPAGDTRP